MNLSWDQIYETYRPATLIIKLANRCNLACSYCYWFQDKSAMAKPSGLSLAVEDAFIQRLRDYLFSADLPSFHCAFHGGEPLLLGTKRMEGLLEKIQAVAQETEIPIGFSLQTNGTLFSSEWCRILSSYQVNVGISLDGPQDIHDKNRMDFKGRGSFQKIMNGIRLLQDHNLPFGVLSVCDPMSDPRKILDFLLGELDLLGVDILLPDLGTTDNFESVFAYYKALFDHWIESYAESGKRVRFFESIIAALLSKGSRIETIGYGANNILTLDSDGALMLVDTLKVCKGFVPDLGLNVLNDSFEQVLENEKFRWIIRESLSLGPKCLSCVYKVPCGGGYLPHRWREPEKNFRNESVYCQDLFRLLEYIENFIKNDMEVL